MIDRIAGMEFLNHQSVTHVCQRTDSNVGTVPTLNATVQTQRVGERKRTKENLSIVWMLDDTK